MTVLYDDRDLPLNADVANAFTTGLVLCWDFTGIGSLSEGEAYEFVGGTNPQLAKTGTINQVTQNGTPGRKANAVSLYEYTNTTDYGLQVGTGDWQIGVLLSTGTSLPSTNLGMTLFEVRNAGGTVLATVLVSEFASNGWYLNAAGTQGLGSSASAVYYGADKTIIFWLRRRSGIVSGWTQEAAPASTLTRRYNDGSSNTTDWSNTSATRVRAVYNSNASHVPDIAVHSVRFWDGSFNDTDTRDIGRDWWALDEYTQVTDELAITTPTASDTIPATTLIEGTYTYAVGAPTGIEVQHGAGSWVALSGFVAAAGTWSGTVELPDAASAALRARDVITTAIVSPDITAIVVDDTETVEFTARNHATYGAAQVVAYRIFQRDANDEASVRIVGAYTGSPAAIEYRFDGGSWATLDASPSGGVFDETVTLAGPAQGVLSVRFSDATDVVASLSAVGVGDVYLVAGQSNHRGGAGSYVAPSAPGAHPAWVACEMDKQHLWRRNSETAAAKFDAVTSAVYSAYTTGSPLGSYFGALASLVMDDGCPVAFVPCAEGSTTLANWDSSSTATSTLYGALLATAGVIGAHKAILWWQGEAEMAGTGTPGDWAADMTDIMAAWATAGQTSRWILVMPCFEANGGDADCTTVRAQIASLAGDANVGGVVDMDDPTPAYAAIHYDTPTEINTVAQRMFDALYQSAAIGLATETDTALALGAAQARAIGQALETDTALALSAVQAAVLGLATEVNTALPLSSLQVLAIGLATETDAALALSGVAGTALGLATEADTALALQAMQVLAVGLATETDSALPLVVRESVAIGLAVEADEAFPLGAAFGLAIGQALEADSALALAGSGAQLEIGLASETDTALALQAGQAAALGLALEIDAAFALSAVQAAVLGLATETDSALAFATADEPVPVPERTWTIPADVRVWTIPRS